MGLLIKLLSLFITFSAYIVTQGSFFGARFRNNKIATVVLVAFFVLSFCFFGRDFLDLFRHQNMQPPLPLKSAREYYLRGNEYSQRAELVAALKDYESALALDSRYSLAYTARGRIYLQQNQPEKALGEFTIAAQIDPSSDEVKQYEAISKDKIIENSLSSLWQDIKRQK